MDFTQAVTLVDDRCYLSGFHETVHNGQVLFVFGLARIVTSFWLTNLDHTSAVIKRARRLIIPRPLRSPTMISLPWGCKTRLHADNEWFPTQSNKRS